MPGVWYTTRETVKHAVDISNSARANEQIDRIIGDVSEQIELDCRRIFHPRIETFSYDYPDDDRPVPWRVWLGGKREMIELLELSSGGTDIALSDVYLYPDEGPPYTWFELARGSNASFGGTSTPQAAITGRALCGWTDVNEHVDVLVSALSPTDTTLTIENGAAIGVGSLLRCGDERLIVTAKNATASGLLTSGALTAQPNATIVPMTGLAGAPAPLEMINIGGERMLVLDVLGSDLIVRRAVDGSVLTAHDTGAAIYVYREVTLRRGAAGTTAAAHDLGALLDVWVPPGPLEGLCVAASLVQIANENSAYARVVGSGEGQREARGAGLAKRWADVKRTFGRRVRMGAAGGGRRAG